MGANMSQLGRRRASQVGRDANEIAKIDRQEKYLLDRHPERAGARDGL